MKPRWDDLEHAYGPASDIPGLLHLAESDLRRGHQPGSTWFQLWSALCHQGDVYQASYAAVPALIRLAERAEYRGNYDPLLLAACIELARLEGTGPELPGASVDVYRATMTRGLELATDALTISALDEDSIQAYRACVAAFGGEVGAARSILDEDGDGAI